MADPDSDDEFMEWLLIVDSDDEVPVPRRTPCRTSLFTGAHWILELLNGHPKRIHETFRMNSDTFLRIADMLLQGNYYTESEKCRVGIHEALGMFLLAVGQKSTQRFVAERFQHSPQTVHKHIKQIGRALCALAPTIIYQKEHNVCHPKILNDPRFDPWFRGCIGALDGTFIPAYVPKWKQPAFRTRKATICQNVMGVCDLDMRFVHVHCGWEGSAHDARVFRHAYATETISFPRPRSGQFYLVDSAFTNMPGFLAPYRQQRYHMPEWEGPREERNKEERFNHSHAKLRNVIERAYGAWKKKFPFLKGPMNNYYFTHQVNMVISCAVLHNIILDRVGSESYNHLIDDDDDDDDDDDENEETDENNGLPTLADFIPIESTPSDLADWSAMRDNMANEMWASRHH